MRITCRAAALSDLTGVASVLNSIATAPAGAAGKTIPSWYAARARD